MRPAVLVAKLNCNPSRVENFSKHCHSSFACDQNGRPWPAEPMQSSEGTERMKFERVA
jgi:hypothetical protein